MDIEEAPAPSQEARWNGEAGQAWVEAQEQLDRLFKPIEDRLADAVRAGRAREVLDIGCGTGATTRAMARSMGPEGCCVGVDISGPMIAAARARAEREGVLARFVQAAAGTHGFEPECYDMIVSRFGVMFFDDPVRAFANLRRAARRDAHLRIFTWRGPEENLFMTTAERAAAPLLPTLPIRRPDEPGQFGLADPAHVSRILEESGWSAIDIRPFDYACAMPKDDLVPYFTRLGPLGLALGQVEEPARQRIIDAVRPAFDPFVQHAEVRFTAACWEVIARA